MVNRIVRRASSEIIIIKNVAPNARDYGFGRPARVLFVSGTTGNNRFRGLVFGQLFELKQ